MKLKHSPLGFLFSLALLACYTTVFVGCSESGTETATTQSGDDHDGDDHDHDGDDHDHDHDHDHDGDHADGHEGHDHPAHGPNGGHMIELSGGAHAEWAHDNLKNQITVYVEEPDSVEKVVMIAKIGEEETPYEFEKKEVDEQTVFQIVSPELLTAATMGDQVETKMVITTKDGELTGKVTHHAH